MSNGRTMQRPGGRSARVRSAVHRALIDLLGQRPWEEITVPLVAERSGVHPATVYRRWGSMSVLLNDVVIERLTTAAPIPDTGSLRENLLGYATMVAESLAEETIPLILRATVLEIRPGEPRRRSPAFQERERQLQAMLDRAQARGEPAPTLPELLELVVAPLYFYALFTTPVRGAHHYRAAHRSRRGHCAGRDVLGESTEDAAVREEGAMTSTADSQMSLPQGDVRLLHSETAQRLLGSTELARFAYVARDGTPRVFPMMFHWTGEEIVFGTFASARKISALRARPEVAIAIDTAAMPPEVLQLRGCASVTDVDGVVPEYVQAHYRYAGPEQGARNIAEVDHPGVRMARIAVRPTWVGVLDFTTRFPGGRTAEQFAKRGR